MLNFFPEVTVAGCDKHNAHIKMEMASQTSLKSVFESHSETGFVVEYKSLLISLKKFTINLLAKLTLWVTA